MANRAPFEIEEWYHCYTRGIDKRDVFNNRADYQRFLETLYLANNSDPLRREDLPKRASLNEIMTLPRTHTLVGIGAYCLMPNHVHMLLQEIREGGITDFMRKLMTSYTMYFNIRHERIGNLFVKPFRSRHVADDRYFQRLVSYIHCNPADLYEPRWKVGEVKDSSKFYDKLLSYPYSSFSDFINQENRPLRAILSEEVFSIISSVSPRLMLKEALAYYREFPQGDTLRYNMSS